MVVQAEDGREKGQHSGQQAGEADASYADYALNPFEGESFKIGPMLVTFKATGSDTAGRFALVEVTVPPYFADILPHLHQQTSEAIYLTQGMLALTLGEETMVVRQGSFILIPPQTVHRVWNPAATQATFLAYYTPAGCEYFFAALAALEAPSGEHQAGTHTGTHAGMWDTGARFDHYFSEQDRVV